MQKVMICQSAHVAIGVTADKLASEEFGFAENMLSPTGYTVEDGKLEKVHFSVNGRAYTIYWNDATSRYILQPHENDRR